MRATLRPQVAALVFGARAHSVLVRELSTRDKVLSRHVGPQTTCSVQFLDEAGVLVQRGIPTPSRPFKGVRVRIPHFCCVVASQLLILSASHIYARQRNGRVRILLRRILLIERVAHSLRNTTWRRFHFVLLLLIAVKAPRPSEPVSVRESI